MPSTLSELTLIIFNMELTDLASEAHIIIFIFKKDFLRTFNDFEIIIFLFFMKYHITKIQKSITLCIFHINIRKMNSFEKILCYILNPIVNNNIAKV